MRKDLAAMMMMILMVMAVVPAAFAETPEPLGMGTTPSFVIGESTENPTDPNNSTNSTVEDNDDTNNANTEVVAVAEEESQESSPTAASSSSRRTGGGGSGIISNTEDDSDNSDDDNNLTGTNSYRRIVSAVISMENKDRLVERIGERNESLALVIESLPEDSTAVLAQLSRAEQDRILEMEEAQIINKLSSYRLEIVDKAMLFVKRVISADKLAAAREKAVIARQDYASKKEELEQARNELAQAIEQKQQEADTIDNAKRYLQNAGDVMISSLERLRYNVEMSESIGEEEASRIMADIELKIQNINEAKQLVANAQTSTALQEGRGAILTSIHDAKATLSSGSELLMKSKLSEIAERDVLLEKKLECSLSYMSGNETEMQYAEGLIDDFSQQVLLAKESIDAGNTTEAQAKLDEAYGLLKSVVKTIKDNGGQIKDCPLAAGIGGDQIIIAVEQ